MAEKKTGSLIRGIGFFGAAFLVLNGMIGAGIFALPAKVADNAGALSPWLFFAVGLLFITIVLSFAELSSYFRESGGPVLYANYAFGPIVGFNTGWLLYLSKVTSFGANANVMVIYLALLLPWVGDGIGRILFIGAFCLLLIVANVVGVKDGIRTMGIMTFFKLVPLLLLVLLGLQYVSGDTLLPADMPTIEDFGGTMLLVVYAFVGFESALVTAGETAQPRRTLPRALVLTIIGTAVFYFLITLVYVSVLPEGGEDKSTLVDVGRVLAGSVGALAITVAAIFSVGSNLSAAMLTIPRLSFSLAKANSLPEWFGRVHEKYSTPHNSIIFFGVLCGFFAITGSFVWLAVATSLSRLLCYMICIASLPVIRKKGDATMMENAYRLKGGYTIPIVAMVLCTWMAMQAKFESWALVSGLLGAGMVLFWLARRQRSNPVDAK